MSKNERHIGAARKYHRKRVFTNTTRVWAAWEGWVGVSFPPSLSGPPPKARVDFHHGDVCALVLCALRRRRRRRRSSGSREGWGHKVGRGVCVSNGGEKMSPDDVSTARGIWGYVRTKQMLDQVEGKVHTVRWCATYV